MDKVEIERRQSNQIVESKTRGMTDVKSKSSREPPDEILTLSAPIQKPLPQNRAKGERRPLRLKNEHHSSLLLRKGGLCWESLYTVETNIVGRLNMSSKVYLMHWHQVRTHGH